MNPIWMSRPGVVCALGSGVDEVCAHLLVGDAGGMLPRMGWLANRTPVLGAVAADLPETPGDLPAYHDSRNNRLLWAAAQQIEPFLRDTVRRVGRHRVAVVLGTSTSGVNDNAHGIGHFARTGQWPAGHDYRRQSLDAPSAFLSEWLGTTGPAYTLSTACTSSARALLTARRLLRLGVCDAVVCGGADTLCRLTINGFASLDAMSDVRCQPFSANRRGINIGEAGVVFVVSHDAETSQGVALLGGGASSDAWHMSAPDPTGAGAIRAIEAALRDAALRPPDIGWVNLHGTGTELNDAMESRAMQAVFAEGVPCASTKPLTGHTLGAAGALEAALSWMVLSMDNAEGRLPPHVWDGCVDPALPALDFCGPHRRFKAGQRRVVMSHSFAFGGNNTSLIFGANHD